MNFSGEFIAPRHPDEVYRLLADPSRFAPLLPDFQSMTVQDATHFTLWLNVGLGNMRGTAEIKMELADASPDTRVRYRGEGKAMGSQLDFNFGFDLAPLQESTRVSWQSGVGLSGGLAAMAGGMLEPLARSNTQKLMDGLQRTLLETTGQPVTAEAPALEAETITAEPIQTEAEIQPSDAPTDPASPDPGKP